MRNDGNKGVGGVPKGGSKFTMFLSDEEMGLLDFVMKKLDGISRNKAKAILTNGGVLVDDEVVTKHNFVVKPDMVVKVSKHRDPLETAQKRGRRMRSYFQIVYEDDFIIVIDKCDEVLSMGVGRNSINMKTLLDNYFIETRQRCHAHVVHRLDVRTSGLMVYAKTYEAQQILMDNWHEIVSDRRYVAVVSPPMDEDSGHVESWLTDTPSHKVFSSNFDNGGKWASTDWELERSMGDFSLITLKLHTGRKNQIRVHMQLIGHPIVGDYKYGSEVDGAERLCLHAFRLAFTHPITGEDLFFETPYPSYFVSLVR